MAIQRQKKRIGLVSLGCAKNLVDSEILIKQLESSRFQVIFEPEETRHLESVIINTCGFIGDAKRESIETILHYANAKRSGNIQHLYLMGCLTERYREELQQEIPEADGVFGVNELPEIIRELGGTYRSHLLGERRITTPAHYAYLKIAEGCDRRCSFCAIPGIRGPHRSRAIEEIIREASYLAAMGVKELIIISQDSTYYGVDLYGRRKLAELLRKLSDINGILWIRLHYTYPQGFPEEVLDVIRNHPNICRYIDIPLQHISNHILRSMKRGLGRNNTRKLLDTIREKVPGVAIRTTFMTGYPGETEADFTELCQFVEQTRFDRLGVFTYSREDHTSAFFLPDTIPLRVKRQRAAELMKIQETISTELNQKYLHNVMNVMIDRQEEEFWIGRSEADSPEVDQEILIRKRERELAPGTFCQVRITGTGPFDLYGESYP